MIDEEFFLPVFTYLRTDFFLPQSFFLNIYTSIYTSAYVHSTPKIYKFTYNLMQIINIKYLQNPSSLVSHPAYEPITKGRDQDSTDILALCRRSRQKNLRSLLQKVSKTAHIENDPRSHEKTPKRPRRNRCLTTKSTSPKQKPAFFTSTKNSSAKTPPP